MNGKVAIIGAHGIGDNMLAHQVAHFVGAERPIDVFCGSRQEVYNVISYLFPETIKLDESFCDGNRLLHEGCEIPESLALYDSIYYVLPDLLFSNVKYRFPWENFVHPATIAKTRLLVKNSTKKKQIYIGLNTTTAGYDYQHQYELVSSIARALPDYTIMYPVVSVWSNQTTVYQRTDSFPDNVTVVMNPDFIESIKELEQSCYLVCADNGISHIGYHLGIPRTLLDPHFRRLPWEARWRQDCSESIPINRPANEVAKIVATNVSEFYTCLVDRKHLIGSPNQDWRSALLVKTQ